MGSSYEITFSASVVVKSTLHPVNSGHVTVDKTAYPIPAVKSVSTTKLAGTSATIIPSYSGNTVSETATKIRLSTSTYPEATTTVSPSRSTATKTSVTSASYPTNTAIDVGESHCFADRSGYLEFTISEPQQVIKSFCSSSYVLDPENTIGRADALEQDGYNVEVSAKWAPDQRTKEAFPFADDELNFGRCLNGWNTDFFGEDQDADVDESYGGAYVLDPPVTGGCILLSLYAYSTSSRRLMARLEGSLIPPTAMNITYIGDEIV